MNRKNVESHNIQSIGWENDTLEVEFKNLALYQYTGVPKSIYLALMDAPSKGQYLNEHIKGTYEYKRVT